MGSKARMGRVQQDSQTGIILHPYRSGQKAQLFTPSLHKNWMVAMVAIILQLD
jgi:hypothetical protein